MRPENQKKSSPKKILLAEDDKSMRRFLEVTLKKLGYQVSTAEDGLAALKIALENEIDAVVADAVMPNLTGYDLCRMLRQNEEKKSVPLIILSGYSQDSSDDARECLAHAYLTKSNNIKKELDETLSKLLVEKN